MSPGVAERIINTKKKNKIFSNLKFFELTYNQISGTLDGAGVANFSDQLMQVRPANGRVMR